MKLNTATQAPITNGVTNTTGFSIAVNGKAFRVLSDTLYSNKIGSCVRELSCNAYDSHIMADKRDTPIEIHLPDGLEPYFSVRDFGVGLSPEAVETVFTRYFESTKDNSNDQIGAFGLGAKTPFAYSDQFTVRSVFNGKVYVYSAYIAGGGLPSISLLSTEDTDEGNGVEISMVARTQDFRRFAEEVASQLRFFKVKPRVLNSANFKFQPIPENPIFQSKNIDIFNNVSGYSNKSFFVQGQVGYPVDDSQIKSKLNDMGRQDLVEFYSMLASWQFIMHFDIGKIGVTASRESMEYDAVTMSSVVTQLESIQKEVTDYVNDSLKTITTVHDRLAFLNKSDFIRRLASGSKVNLGNAKLTNGRFGFHMGGFVIESFTDPTTGKQDERKLMDMVTYSSGNIRIRDRFVNTVLYPDLTNTLVLFRDTASKPLVRMEYFIGQHNYSNIVVFTPVDGKSFSPNVIAEFRKYVGDFAGGAVKLVSELPEPPKTVSEKNGERKKYSRFFGYTYTDGATNTRDCVKIDQPLEDYFDNLSIALSDVAYIHVGTSTVIPHSTALTQLRAIRNLFNDKVNVIVVRDTDLEDAKEAGVRSVDEYVKDRLVAIKADPANLAAWITNIKRVAMNNTLVGDYRDFFTKNVGKVLDTEMTDYVTFCQTIDVAYNKLGLTGNRIAFLNSVYNNDSNDYSAVKEYKEVKEYITQMQARYPMVLISDHWATRDVINAARAANPNGNVFLDYVNALYIARKDGKI